MAIITKLPGQHIIDGFKGKLDYYVYMGVACVRRWPKSPGRNRAPMVMAQWSAFGYSAAEWNNLSPVIRRACEALATGSGLSGRDIFTRGYLSGLYRNPLP